AAIDACAKAGGGTVSLAPGVYRCGAVILKSNITFNIGEGATLLGSTSLDDYISSGPENKHLIIAKDAENVTVLGAGRIDGQGSAFWKPSGKTPKPPEEGWNDVIARYWAPIGPRPSPMLNFVNCKGLRLEQLHIGGAAGWTMQFLNCDQVGVRGITVKNPNYGPNTDGMDIVGSSNVLISDCSVYTGDDAIVLKSDKYTNDQPHVTRNITVTNCVVTTCCNGLKIGTETQGGFENITITNCTVHNDDVNLRERVSAGIALEMVDGGWIDGVHISGIKMQRTRTPIFIRLGNRSKKFDNPQHGLRNVTIENVQASEAIVTSTITGIENAYVENVTLSNIKIDGAVAGQKDWVDRPVPEHPDKYPESHMFGMPPASGIYCRHVRGLQLSDVTFRSPADEQRPVMICDDVRDIKVSALSSTSNKGQEPVVKLIQCANAVISHSAAPIGSKPYLAVEGHDSASIVLSGCDLHGAKRAFDTSGDVPAGAVTENDNR
ncbi:MAG: glycosyl hydrolase family 28 protein, partial [Terracidiphilus sp.]